MNKRTLIKIISIVIGISVLLPILIYIGLYLPLPSPHDVGNVEWTSFWGSYCGGAIGGVCTLIALFCTICFYEKQEETHRQEILETEDRMYRPLLLIRPNGGGGIPKNYATVFIQVKNVGAYTAAYIRVNDRYIHLLEANQETCVTLDSENGKYPKTITVVAESVFGKSYSYICELKELKNMKNDKGNDRKETLYYQTKPQKF